eukprot:4407044-Alexandrium_andersonii.AAC.1
MMRGVAGEESYRVTLLGEAAECEDEVYGVALSDGGVEALAAGASAAPRAPVGVVMPAGRGPVSYTHLTLP